MCIAGYLSRDIEVRMPKGPDSIGIKFEGPVLSGEQSVQQGLEGRNTSFTRAPAGHLIYVSEMASAYNEWKHKRMPGKFGPSGVAGVISAKRRGAEPKR